LNVTLTDDEIRTGLNRYADSIQSTPPPIARITGTPAHSIPLRTGRGRRAIFVALGSAGVLITAGAAAASGLFSSATADFVETVCGLNVADARIVASDTDGSGNLVTLSVISRPAGDGTILAVTDPDGQMSFESGDCGPWPGGSQNPNGRPWASSPSVTLDGQSTTVQLFGWIPRPASIADVTFADGHVEQIEAEADGYFLRLLTTTPNPDTEVTHIAARTADGSLVAEGNPTG
jgi:prepilin-type processing-associated H-X9-DG protein